ncbi:hypothetical protein CCACVL1_11917 [Corchorus capsularis]|uniref:Prolamin-like domain-containing protein n=1 Tax=Corchorus capsularis TaxID=210143 RepID=A0A1R3IIW5_COCAP|nr:hypothetical protein CCACVL1_11917 [Corchorus capsularis]
MASQSDDIIKANNCEEKARKMDSFCLNEIFEGVFKSKDVEPYCCTQLYDYIGQTCHEAFVKRTLENPKFKNENATQIYLNSGRVSFNCGLIVTGSPTGQPNN